jgi:hypothetical protein
MNTPNPSIEELKLIAQEIADSMTIVATQIAMLGVQGDADEQMGTIKKENDKVLSRIRALYHLPDPGDR